MRGTADRIRHAISFELIAIMIVMVLGAWLFGVPMKEMGVIGVIASCIATAFNYVFNLGFDHALLRLRGAVHKTFGLRVLHAALFEIALLAALVPLIAWYLEISLLEALLMDLVLAGFFLFYTFAFNWAYDLIFPVPEPRRPLNEMECGRG